MNIMYKFLTRPEEVQKAAWVTARKVKGKDFNEKILATYLLSEHSPIRRLILSWYVSNIPHRAMTHLVRHVHTQPYVASTRPDWYGEHSADPTTDVLFDSNAEALIALARKRLCARAFIDTKHVIDMLKLGLMCDEGGKDVKFFNSLGWYLVPNCVYRCGCPEGSRTCHWWETWSSTLPPEMLRDIRLRYKLYNITFMEEHKNDLKELSNSPRTHLA